MPASYLQKEIFSHKKNYSDLNKFLTNLLHTIVLCVILFHGRSLRNDIIKSLARRRPRDLIYTEPEVRVPQVKHEKMYNGVEILSGINWNPSTIKHHKRQVLGPVFLYSFILALELFFFLFSLLFSVFLYFSNSFNQIRIMFSYIFHHCLDK